MFIKVHFFNNPEKAYTYKTSLDIQVGDFVVVPTQDDNTVAVVSKVNIKEPSFTCKNIIRRVNLSDKKS